MVLAGAYVKINALGFRDYEYSLKKPIGYKRIAIIGDSFTFGYGVQLNESYPKLMEKKLNSSQKIQVLNFGGNGANTLLESIYFNSTVKYFEPDLTIIGFTMNDVDFEYNKVKVYCNDKYPNARKESKNKVYYIIRGIKILSKYGVYPNQMDNYFLDIYDKKTPGFLCFREGLEKFSNRNDIIFLIIPTRPGGDKQKIYDGLMDIVIEEIKYYNITVYSLNPYFTNFSQATIQTVIGAPHYNHIGNQIISNATVDLLKDNGFI
jgi:lysophospholipase L1-like esterase